jgi:hypothetical protein
MADTQLASIAEAEKLLNRTLVYQAAVAVHELKERLNLDVAELRLVVAPESVDAPGCYRVTCTIAGLTEPKPVKVDVLVRPEQAIAPGGSNTKAAPGRKQAKPAARGRVRRSHG